MIKFILTSIGLFFFLVPGYILFLTIRTGFARVLSKRELEQFKDITLYTFTVRKSVISSERVHLIPSPELRKHVSSGYRQVLFFFIRKPTEKDIKRQKITHADLLVSLPFAKLDEDRIRYRSFDKTVLYLGEHEGDASWSEPDQTVVGMFNKGIAQKVKDFLLMAWCAFLCALSIGGTLFLVLIYIPKRTELVFITWAIVIGAGLLYMFFGNIYDFWREKRKRNFASKL